MNLSVCNDPVMPAEVQDLYESAFPEAERRLWNPRPRGLKLLVARDGDGKFLGFITTWSLSQQITYVEHFAIHPGVRGSGLGGKIIDSLRGNVLLEVELPDTPEARRRVEFYRRHGFEAAEGFRYVQPSYAPSLPPVPMMLMYRGEIDLRVAALDLHAQVYGVKP